MKLEELAWMTELFRTRKMSKAAEALFISQPALTQCVQRIEAELGFPLFSRSNKGLVPTEKGELFYQMALDTTARYREFLTQTRLMDQEAPDVIRIAMPPYMSVCCSAEMLRDLTKSFPFIRFSIHEGSSVLNLEALRSNEVQLMVSNAPIDAGRLKARSFGRVPVVLLLRKDSPAADHAVMENGIRYLDPYWLDGEPFAMTQKGQGTRRVMDELLSEAGAVPSMIHEARQITALYQYALAGMASAITPITPGDAERDREHGLIYRIPDKYHWSYLHLVLLVRPELEKRIPDGVYETIENCIMQSRLYCWREEDLPRM